tara:strand:- start:2157 stop:2498 length:342 start_codon:yes stop_codon:yes gene_type:complete
MGDILFHKKIGSEIFDKLKKHFREKVNQEVSIKLMELPVGKDFDKVSIVNRYTNQEIPHDDTFYNSLVDTVKEMTDSYSKSCSLRSDQLGNHQILPSWTGHEDTQHITVNTLD